MTLDMAVSIVLLSGFIWTVRVMLPRAVTARDGLALTCAVLTAILAMLAWLMIGTVPLRGLSP